jgi:hypothetical protein
MKRKPAYDVFAPQKPDEMTLLLDGHGARVPARQFVQCLAGVTVRLDRRDSIGGKHDVPHAQVRPSVANGLHIANEDHPDELAAR